jgi:CrcB protein
MLWLAIAIGGGLGAVARHAVSHLFNLRFGTTFPAGIFVVNAIGCLTIGLLAGLIASTRLHLGEVGRTFVFVGILGGFTTFSSYGLDTYTLLRGGAHGTRPAQRGRSDGCRLGGRLARICYGRLAAVTGIRGT